MPFRTKVQPFNSDGVAEEPPMLRQVPKSRLKRLFERPFSLKSFPGVDSPLSRGNSGEFEPSSLCLRNMVERYIEDPDNEKQLRCGGLNPCNCFSASGTDSSDEDEESISGVLTSLKRLLLCANIYEKNLEITATEIVEKDDQCKPKEDSILKTIAVELAALGYDAAICKSRLEKSKLKSCSCPAGEYEYLDVMIGKKRVVIDFDFQSKFEIARPTGTYKSISETLPYIFVGQVDRLKKVVVFVSKAAKKSFKKKGLSMPPWRRAESVLAKWLSPYKRAQQTAGETSGEAARAKASSV